MSGVVGKREPTFEDLLALPDEVLGQLVEGELHATPRPAIDHQRASSTLGFALGASFDSSCGGPGGWWVFDGPEVHLGRNVLVPDLAGWRRERLPALPREAFFTLAPDWVGEVLSPATARLDRLKKLVIYAREGVGHAWLVDPGLETLEVYRRQGEAWLLVLTAGGDDIVRAEPFDAIELTLTGLSLRPA